jgi:hypothetical protein
MDQKECYTEPVMTAHDLLRDITAVTSGKYGKEQDGVLD